MQGEKQLKQLEVELSEAATQKPKSGLTQLHAENPRTHLW